MVSFLFVLMVSLGSAVAEEASSPSPLSSFGPVPSAAVRGVVIEGVLLEKGTKRPVPDANLYILPAKLKATTDSAGRFRVTDVPEGEFTFVVNLTGYDRLDQPDYQSADIASPARTLYLPKVSYQVYETTVYGKQNQRDDSTKSLKASVATKLPGSNNDPIKAIQNLPGVSRASSFNSAIIIQGSAPQDTRYLVDGHEVPIIFHFGGFSSVVLPEALDRIDYLSAGYGAEYGRAMGGQVGVWTRKPDRDRLKGFIYADFINAGGAIETPVGEKGSLTLGLRQSYIGALLKAATDKSSEKDKDDRDTEVTAAPAFRDFTLVYDTPLSEKDDFRLDFLASEDALDLIVSDAPANDPKLRGGFENRTSFIRFIPQWTHRHGERTTSRWSLGLGRDWVKVILDDQYFRLATYSITARGEVEQKWNESFTSFFGMDHSVGWAKVDLNFPDFYSAGGVSNPISTGNQQRIGVRSSAANLGFYVNNDMRIGEVWDFKPGLRFDYFSTTRDLHPAPRFAVKHNLSTYESLRLGTGMYFQPPRPQETADGVGNPSLEAPRAKHLALTYEKDFREGLSKGWVFEGGPFFRTFEKLIVPSSAIVTRDGVTQPEFYNNTGEGRAFGYEMLLRYEANPWTGWISYTASRSTRRQPGQPWYPSAYDQTHNLNLILGRDLPRNWKIAGRFRLVTGNPLTPVVGSVFDADNDAYIPIRGPFYSDRIGSFYQLDVRVDKKWIYDRMIVTAYLDIQNITNHKNTESVSYAYDYSSRTDLKGLPIIPSIGLKGEF